MAGDSEASFTARDPDLDWYSRSSRTTAGGIHGIEAVIWAAAYIWLGALDSPKDAILYSVDSMTTRGASGLMLQQHWRIVGALEAAGGMLLFGISTAYIFAVMQMYWPMLSKPLMTTVTQDEST